MVPEPMAIRVLTFLLKMKWSWREYRVAKGGIRLETRIYRGKVFPCSVSECHLSRYVSKRNLINLQEQIKER